MNFPLAVTCFQSASCHHGPLGWRSLTVRGPQHWPPFACTIIYPVKDSRSEAGKVIPHPTHALLNR